MCSADSEFKVEPTVGCRQLLLALAPSPHCAAALSARGLELESLLQQADDAIISVDVAADGMQRDEL